MQSGLQIKIIGHKPKQNKIFMFLFWATLGIISGGTRYYILSYLLLYIMVITESVSQNVDKCALFLVPCSYSGLWLDK